MNKNRFVAICLSMVLLVLCGCSASKQTATTTAVSTTQTTVVEKEYSPVGVWNKLNYALMDAGIIRHSYFVFTSDGNVLSVSREGTITSGMVWLSWYDYECVGDKIVSEGTWKKEGADYFFYNPDNDTKSKIVFDGEDDIRFDPEIESDKLDVPYSRMDDGCIPWSEIKINCVDETGKELDLTLADVWSQQ